MFDACKFSWYNNYLNSTNNRYEFDDAVNNLFFRNFNTFFFWALIIYLFKRIYKTKLPYYSGFVIVFNVFHDLLTNKETKEIVKQKT